MTKKILTWNKFSESITRFDNNRSYGKIASYYKEFTIKKIDTANDCHEKLFFQFKKVCFLLLVS